jgi:hypothetical protein
MTLPNYVNMTGASFAHATVLPPGGKVAAYVRSGGPRSGETLPAKDIVTTLNAGLARVRAGVGDIVVVLPDHAESISSADQMTNLVAGTHIIGAGAGSLRPTFTWTAATATFLFDVANTRLSNCILRMAGSLTSTTALSVAAPITVSAAGCGLYGCDINVGVDADQLATIAITTTAAADDFQIGNCKIWGNAGAAVTTALRLVGADRMDMWDTDIIAETSAAAVGVVQHITTASTLIRHSNCTFVNLKSDSSAAYTGLAASSGTLRNCGFGYYGNAGLSAITTPGNLQCFNCQTVNEEGETGAASATASA